MVRKKKIYGLMILHPYTIMDIKELSNPFKDDKGHKADYGKLYEFLSLKFNKAMFQLTKSFQDEQNLRRLLQYQRVKNDSIIQLIGMIDKEKEAEEVGGVFERLRSIVSANPDMTDVVERIIRLESGDDVEVDQSLNDVLFFQELSSVSNASRGLRQPNADENEEAENESEDAKRVKEMEKAESLPLNKACWLKEHYPNIFSS